LTMLLLACIGILGAGLLNTDSANLKILYEMLLLMSAGLWGGSLLLLFFGGLTGPWVIGRVETLPVAGKTIARMLATVQVYRSCKVTLFAAFVVSLVMAWCYVTSYWLVAKALPIDAPSWSQHLTIVPVAGLVGAVPLTPSGLGTTEFTIEEQYKRMPGIKTVR